MLARKTIGTKKGHERVKLLIRKYGRVIGLCLFVVVGCGQAAPRIPVSVPLKFGIDRAVEFSVTIDRYRNYYLDLVVRFENNDERKFARQVVGDATDVCRVLNDCGEISSFNITIKSGDKVILQLEKQAYGHFGFGENVYARNILVVPLRPEMYTFRSEIIDFGSKLKSANTELTLSTDPRDSDLD